MRSGRRTVVIAAGAAIVVALLVLVVATHRPARQVAVVSVNYAPFTIALPESGVIQYPQIQTMSSRIAGNVGRINVKTGQRVVAGQLLATIENPQVLSNAASSAAAYRSASARAQSAEVTGGSNLAQAQANLETARTRLAQAQQDLANGLQPGLGYGQNTAAQQRAAVASNLATATTNLRAAERMYAAYRDLYDNKAVSRDQVDQAQARYQQAKGTYEQARLAQSSLSGQLSRSHEVLEDNLVSAREGLAQAQAQLVAAQVESGSGDVAAAHAEATRAAAEYSFARAQAGAMQIRAPYDATVLSVAPERNDPLRPLQPGDSVDAGQAILTLAAPRGFIVRTKVDEQDVINVRLGERAQITGEDFPGRTLAGRVVEISPIAQRADSAAAGSRTVATTIAIDRPPAYLRDGMSADVKIFTTDLPRALAVPNDAIVRDGEASYVFVVSGARAHRQAVRAGAANETNSLILSGLRAGDIVVAPSIAGLDDGNPVSFAASPEPVR